MNSIDRIDVSTSQMAFKANRKNAIRFIDATNKALKERNRSLDEQKETIFRESVPVMLKKFFKSSKSDKKAFEQYKKFIMAEVKAGRIDADHAISLLANKHSLNLNI